jgi:hypothetical protein
MPKNTELDKNDILIYELCKKTVGKGRQFFFMIYLNFNQS